MLDPSRRTLSRDTTPEDEAVQIELALALGAELHAWPPRLPEQPIFYPVLNRGYAAEIARK